MADRGQLYHRLLNNINTSPRTQTHFFLCHMFSVRQEVEGMSEHRQTVGLPSFCWASGENSNQHCTSVVAVHCVYSAKQ